jgi:hypothetical protein
VLAKLERAMRLIERAGASPARRAVLLRNAKKALRAASAKIARAARGRTPRLSAECAAALAAAAAKVAAGLGV